MMFWSKYERLRLKISIHLQYSFTIFTGTGIIAGMQTGRNVIGVEKDEAIVRHIHLRVSKEVGGTERIGTQEGHIRGENEERDDEGDEDGEDEEDEDEENEDEEDGGEEEAVDTIHLS